MCGLKIKIYIMKPERLKQWKGGIMEQNIK